MLKIQLIRNATLRLSYNNKVILIDPYLAPKGSLDSLAGKEKNPIVELPLSPEEVISNVDMVLISHLHTDHFDEIAQEMIQKTVPIYCQPEDEMNISEMGFEKVTVINEEVIWENIKIIRTPGQHGYGDWAERLAPVSGFIFEFPEGNKIYWCGDTVLYEEVKQVIKRENPEVIITHSSGSDFQGSGLILMDAEQTVEVCALAPNSKIIVTHMESLDHGTITRNDIKQLAEERNILKERILIPEDGDIINL